MPNPYRGEVTFTIDGEDYTVRPTFQIIAEIESQYGGIMPLAKRIASGDFTITEIVGVILIALKGQKGAPKPQELQELIFEEGATNFLVPISTFLANALTSGNAAPKAGGNSGGKAAGKPGGNAKPAKEEAA